MELGIHEDVLVAALPRSRPIRSSDESAEIDDDVLTQSPTVFVVDPDPVTGRWSRICSKGQN